MAESKSTTSFDPIAEKYDEAMGNTGDYTHQNTIDPAFFKAIGNFKDKIVYDIACGNGYIARRLAREGAKEIWASDISEKLITIAKTKYNNPGNKIKFFVSDASDFSKLPKDYFDLVIINMSIHYIKNFDRFAAGLNLLLKVGGRFVFTTGHPLRKLALMKLRGKRGSDLNSVLSSTEKYNIFREGLTFNVWSRKRDLLIYYAPISYYINTLSRYNIFTNILVEPKSKMIIEDVDNSNPQESPIPIVYALGARKIQPT